ncbi:PilW family protein [Roseateles aquae]|nr:hypothetical protein [Paucibacter sp. APW11]
MRRFQAGVSLISLMVGLAISMFAVMGALALYRSASLNMFGNGGLVRNAAQDGQLASGLLSAQIALQGAGYGISNAASGTDLLLLGNGSISNGRLSGTPTTILNSATSGNLLVWGEQINGVYRCQALLIDSNDKSLRLYKSSGSCSPLASNWNGAMGWSSSTLIAPHVLSQAPRLSLRGNAGCWPYGAVPNTISSLAAPSAPLELQLGYDTSTAGASNTYTLCLSNFRS